MTRKSKREIERTLEELEHADGRGATGGPIADVRMIFDPEDHVDGDSGELVVDFTEVDT